MNKGLFSRIQDPGLCLLEEDNGEEDVAQDDYTIDGNCGTFSGVLKIPTRFLRNLGNSLYGSQSFRHPGEEQDEHIELLHVPPPKSV